MVSQYLHRFPRAFILLAALFAWPAMAVAAIEQRGQTASGAYYIAQAPESWRAGDALVLINHGYRIDPISPEPSLGPMPLRQHMLARGYAIVASSYSQRGWALFQTERDHRELVAAFSERFGTPGSIIATGGSMGGLVSLQQAEQTDLGAPVSGVYALCAPLAGTRVWDQALDLRLAYDRVCDNVTGGELPSGDSAFPYILKASDINSYGDLSGGGQLALRIAKCTGYKLPSWLVTSGMRQRMQRLQDATGVDPEFFLENMFYATYGISELVRDPAKIGERPALGNRHVIYGEASVQSGIRRVDADAFAALDLKRHFTPTGRVGQAKVLTTHTSGDGLVVPEHARALEGKIPPQQWSQAFVVESKPSHCDYSDAELIGGFESLTRWIDNGPRPDPLSLQAECELQRAANPSLGACRYAPGFAPGALDAKLKPRNLDVPAIDADVSGTWYDPARPGEGFVLEALGGGNVVVTWFTYPVPGASNDQAWYTGLGRVLDNAVVVDRMEGRRGGSFNGPIDPTKVQTLPLGRLDAVLQSCGQGEYRVQAPAPFGDARRNLQRLSGVGRNGCPGATPVPSPSPFVAWSGAWYEADKSGRGVFLQVQDDGRAFLVWFSFRPDGEPAWLVGEGRAEGADLVFDQLTRPVGARFGTAFDPAAVQLQPWGSVRLTGNGCSALQLSFQSGQPGYGSGLQQLTRLTTPLGAGCL